MKVEFGQCGDCAFWGKANGMLAVCSKLNSADQEEKSDGLTKFHAPSNCSGLAVETNKHFGCIRFRERA